MNKNMRLLSTLIVASLMLTACGAGEATPSALEPTRTPSSASTPAPRPTKGPPDTPAPKPTARALAKNAITLDNAAGLKVQATRDEAAVTQIYAVKGNRVLGVSSRSFEMLDADTLETKTKMPYALTCCREHYF